jgi:putative hydrolase of the HAD superfamily
MIKFIVLDAANTLIHKPEMWSKWLEVLFDFGYNVDISELKKIHKLTSETILFPDKTDKVFYDIFNAKVLCNLGVDPTYEMLTALFATLTYLKWESFEDVETLNTIEQPLVIASNFNNQLTQVITSETALKVNRYFVSAEMGVRKPALDFYKQVIKELGVEANEILYIGDSMELDVIPASKLGIRSYLIDRDDLFPRAKNRIRSMKEVKFIVNND